MRYFLAFWTIVLAPLAGGAYLQHQVPQRIADPTCVTGITNLEKTSTPVSQVRISFKKIDAMRALSVPSSETIIDTDDLGRFSIKGLAPGNYRAHAQKFGFVDTQYGEGLPPTVGTVIRVLPSGECTELVFHLIPAGVIAGRVVDHSGRPVRRAVVQAESVVYREGKSTFKTLERSLGGVTQPLFAVTNDLGEYRLFWVQPGDYYVVVNSVEVFRGSSISLDTLLSDGFHKRDSYARLYAPGVENIEDATIINVNPAAVAGDVDIAWRRIPTLSIFGKVQIPGNDVRENSTRLSPDRRRPMQIFITTRDGSRQIPAQISASGDQFTINRVLPGTYRITVILDRGGRVHVGSATVDVDNRDLRDIAVRLLPPVVVSGSIRDQLPFPMDNLRVVLTRRLPVSSSQHFKTNINRDGTFTLSDIARVEYQITIEGQDGAYLDEVWMGSVDLSRSASFTPANSGARLTLRVGFDPAQLSGSAVGDDQKPRARALVLLVPEEAFRLRRDKFFSAATDESGHFEFTRVPPGVYKVFASEQAFADPIHDPFVMRQVGEYGTAVHLEKGSHIRVTTNVVRPIQKQ
jgi:protocatechuate 3,4-dioxygenase beta subunit